MRVAQTAYTVYGFIIFIALFLLLFPFLLIPIFFSSHFRLTGILNRWWARLLFFFIFISFEVEERFPLDRKRKYIFCPNHFSYLDIPTLGLNPVNAIFVGKNAMEKIPLFGFMYRRLHITVNRSSFRSRGNTLLASMKALDEGKSLVIYPEGGMITAQPPHMSPFKDGAFRLAIEKQVAIVPVTIPFNWKLLPDQSTLRLRHGKGKVIFHEPIETVGLSLAQTSDLKKQVFRIINIELKHQNSSPVVSSHA
ncbi:MAG: 1-acyl-sn-glycerol-3-phosphate acyltransferase [Bacteroidetes bacterium]|nr:1-acyl-sn-glycerol-3-phosphate acyltransferase [Bacteroidota bacterium]